MKFVLFYKGPTPPSGASHKGWMVWFARLGDAVVDIGSPLFEGTSLHDDGSVTDSTAGMNGYSVIRAKDKDEVLELIRDHPYLKLGQEYTIEVFQRR